MALAGGALVLLAVSSCVPDEYGRLEAIKSGTLVQPAAERIPFNAEVTAACETPTITAAGETALARRPYLQRVTARSAALLWTSPAGTEPARLSWRAATSKAWSTDEPATVDSTAQVPGHIQLVTEMEALKAGTYYCYRLRDAAGNTLASSGFRTAPAAGTGEMLRFSAVADSGDVNADSAANVAMMKTVHSDLVLAPGDIAYDNGTLAEYEDHFFAPFSEMLGIVPFFPSSGNHEYKTASAAPFRQVFSLPENGGPEGVERWYSFDWGDVHFVVLDTERLGKAQKDWLEADLSSNQLPWTIAVFHKPPFSSGNHGSAEDVRAVISPILERHHVQLALSGHDHNYERTEPQNGVTYVVTGGGGGHGTKRVGSSSFTAFSEQVTHFVYVEVDGSELRLHAIDASGKEFDGVVIGR